MAIYTSILTGGSNNHETTSEAANGAQTDLIGEGVVGAITNTGGVAPATGALAVNAQGTPAMAVDVSAGLAYVTATPTGQNSQNLRIRNTATASVSISANSTGSTKYDWIYLAVDATKAANPAVDGDDVASLVVSRSTSSSSDDGTPPTYATLLAKVTVANGATSITNGNIADARSNITLPANSVDTEQLKDDAVTSAKIDWAATGGGDSGGIWWEELGRTTLGSAGDTVSVQSLPPRKYLKVLIYVIDTGGTVSGRLLFNNDTGNNYANRFSANGASDTTETSNSAGIPFKTTAAETATAELVIINISNQEKLLTGSSTTRGTAGAANAPSKMEISCKWANTSAQINRIDAVNTGTGDFAVGSEVVVLGHD